MTQPQKINVGAASIELIIEEGCLRSLGAVTVNGVALRNPVVPWKPWFDSYDGGVFNVFRDPRIETHGPRIDPAPESRGRSRLPVPRTA